MVGSFDWAYASTSAQVFLRKLSDLNSREVWVGRDFRFGKGQAGEVELLGTHFQTRIIDPICGRTGEVISSTRIRSFLVGRKPDYAETLPGLAAMVRNSIRVSPVWRDPDLVARVDTSTQSDLVRKYSHI